MTSEDRPRKSSVRAATFFMLSALSLYATAIHAQALRITAANSSNSAVYDVNFSGTSGSITTLNTDQSDHVSIRSLVYVRNTTTNTIDLLAADSSRGQLLLYPAGVGVATVVWDTTQSAGPMYPDGLSVDADGNLFVVSSAPGGQPAQLWVLPHNDPSRTGGYGLPRLIDSTFGGLAVQRLAETLVARAPVGTVGLSDLLVLASEPATVLVYSAARIASVIAGSPEIDPSSTLISASQFPVGAVPGGLDYWPLDSTMLITTGDGRILRYAGAVRLPDFASGLGNGEYKVRTGWESGQAFAFVAKNNGGKILKFRDGGGTNPPVATVTGGVQSPQGLTTTNMAAANAVTCLDSSGGCDVLGGVLKHNIKNLSSLSGTISEDICIVQTDPRITLYGTCTAHSLPVSQVCAGFGSTVIPDTLCGGAGRTTKGFALIKSSSPPIAKGALVSNKGDIESVLGATSNLPCPQTVLAWAPTPGEGTIAEDNAISEITSGCGSTYGNTYADSTWAIGLVLNEGALTGTGGLVGFASTKYKYLNATINSASIQSSFRRQLLKCVSDSSTKFDRGGYDNYVKAAGQLRTCDLLVAQSEAQFASSVNHPNPSGDVRSRLANLYFTIYYRIANPTTTPPASW